MGNADMTTEGVSSDYSSSESNSVDSTGDAGDPVGSDKMQDLKSAYQENGIQGLLEELAKLIEETAAKPETPPAGGPPPAAGGPPPAAGAPPAEPPAGEEAPSIEEMIKQIVEELKLSEGEGQELTEGATGNQATETGQKQKEELPSVSHSDAMFA
jgi:hypothetical protein